MRIKSVRLKNYKRFTELSIANIPETARLVVLVGPNGSGKSSVFDSFLLKAGLAVNRYRFDDEGDQYYDKNMYQSQKSRDIHAVANRVEIEFHEAGSRQDDLKSAFQIRSAYRHESDFRVSTLERVRSHETGPRFTRIIDNDESVSRNYKRMAWKGMQDLHQDAPEDQTFAEYRETSLGDLKETMRDLFAEPPLILQDFGGIGEGAFRFHKGGESDFHYKNLSGGEKAAFDILLDVFVKRDVVPGAVFCIDEPELHVATALQGGLVRSILKLLPEQMQLWVATHSIGIVREAYRMYQEQPGEVAFLDFSHHDFDESVEIKPNAPNRVFWQNIYKVALDDLASLVAPELVIICEGSKDRNVNAFDAECYNKLFEDKSPETLFIARGGAKEVVGSEHLVAILKAVTSGTRVFRLIDRDDMTDEVRAQQIDQGIHVLRRRELEEYLWDVEVLRTFLKASDCDEAVVEEVLNERESLLNGQLGPCNVKDVSQKLFQKIRATTRLSNLGNGAQEFAVQHLVPALRNTENVYDEICKDVFGHL